MTEPQNANIKFRLDLVYLLLYGTIACYYPFLALYFSSRNLSYTQIGIAFAINSLVGIIAQPIWGYITDKYLNKKKTLLIASMFCSVLIFNFVAAHNFFYIIAAIVLLLVFQSVTSPITDAYCYEIIEHTNSFNFGEVRLMGSVSFALVSLGLGKLIELKGIDSCFFVYSILFLIYASLISGFKFKGTGNIKRPSFKDVLDTVKQFEFMLFVFSVLIINIALGANSSYIAMLVQKTGGSTAILGFVWFVIAISEIPAFFFGNHLSRRYGELNIYLFAVALYSIRFFLCSFNQSYIGIIIIQLMQSITFPVYLMGAMQYVNRIVPEQIKASGITILSALGFGLGSFIGNLAGGILLENRDVFFLYRSLSVVCVISLLIGIFLKSKKSIEVKKAFTDEVHPKC
ncbi:MAG: MFS transporter [Caulobacteraceae bacterium]